MADTANCDLPRPRPEGRWVAACTAANGRLYYTVSGQEETAVYSVALP